MNEPRVIDTATQVNKAMQGMVRGFAELQPQPTPFEPFVQELAVTFSLKNGFREKLADMDRVVDRSPAFEPLREILFDLLMVRYLSTDSKMMDPDYLDSPDWLKIEDETIDRGSEMLNLLLYLCDCLDSEVEPSLDDFLEEFLLVNEEEFADELVLYEDIIENRELAGEDAETIVATHQKLGDDSQVIDFFIPLFAFFSEVKSNELKDQLKQHHTEPAVQFAIYNTLKSFAE